LGTAGADRHVLLPEGRRMAQDLRRASGGARRPPVAAGMRGSISRIRSSMCRTRARNLFPRDEPRARGADPALQGPGARHRQAVAYEHADGSNAGPSVSLRRAAQRPLSGIELCDRPGERGRRENNGKNGIL